MLIGYVVGISHIPRAQAAKLINSTAMIPTRNSESNEREYIIELDVFHQLHCLVCLPPLRLWLKLAYELTQTRT
jgi:hypothetical protein